MLIATSSIAKPTTTDKSTDQITDKSQTSTKTTTNPSDAPAPAIITKIPSNTAPQKINTKSDILEIPYETKYTNPQTGVATFGKSFDVRLNDTYGWFATYDFYLPVASYVYIDVNGFLETQNDALYVAYIDGKWGDEQYIGNYGSCNADVLCNIKVQRTKMYRLEKGFHTEYVYGWLGGLPNYDNENNINFAKFYGDISIMAFPEFTALTVLSPNGGETLYRGQTRTVTWKSDGKPATNVIIDLYKGSSRILQITSKTANDGSFSWYIPTILPQGTDYKIKITSYEDNKYTDWSNNYFRIY